MWAVSPSQDAPSYWGKQFFGVWAAPRKKPSPGFFVECRQDAQTTFPFFGEGRTDSRRVTWH